MLVAGRSHGLDAPPGRGRMTSLFQMTSLFLKILAAVIFGIGFGVKYGAEKASDFFAGYLLEKSLSVDNLFVFVLIFKYFKVPTAYQQSTMVTTSLLSWMVFGKQHHYFSQLQLLN